MTDHEDGQIVVEQRGRLLLIGIDRPRKLNGFTPKMLRELAAAYSELERREEAWVGVLHASGAHTTAGLDLPKIAPFMDRGEALMPPEDVDPFDFARQRTKPVVAAVKGICYTIGIELMLAADIVIAAADCRFAQLEVKRNLLPTGGATIRITERAGYGNAMYLMLTGMEIGAEAALRMGLVQEVVAPGEELARAVALAELVAAQAPAAVRATRRNALLALEQGPRTAVAEFESVQQRLRAMQDGAEALASFVEKRAPRFTGR